LASVGAVQVGAPSLPLSSPPSPPCGYLANPLPNPQGRLPIRVELKGLTAEDFYRILTEPHNNMIRQQQVGADGGRRGAGGRF
jgi:hypothetical protein